MMSNQHRLLEEALDKNRASFIATLDGLSEEQVRRHLVPSLTTLLGLAKHVANSEKVWFQSTLAGRPREELGLSYNIDDSYRLSDADTIATITANFAEAVAASRRIVAAYDLEHEVEHPFFGTVTLRWIYPHMIAEIARHAGHADILREQILATDQTPS